MRINCKYQKLVPSDTLVEHEMNANKHPDKQIQMLAKILKYQGWRHPIVVSNLSGKIVAGHGRLAAAKLNGWSEVPVDMQDFDDKAQELAFLASDNKIAELADHDDDKMIELIKSTDIDDLELFGLDDFDLNKIDPEVKNTSAELDINAFDNFDHQCPKCGFEWNNDGSDNS
jgi:CRISPR/Cas system-associated endonuclease/helicase Cas3